jgi:cytidine deaminase
MPADIDWDELTTAARHASAAAYAPYSRFAVGAAVRAADGRIYAGCNVENASYGLSVCAERNAIFQAVAAGARDLAALVVYTPTPAPFTPCGACRQVLLEFGRDATVLCACDGAAYQRFTAASLLPAGFALPGG